VEELGIKELLPAYLDPNLQPTDLLTGVCFASGGAGYDPLTSQTSSAISLSGQLELFKEYIGKLRVLVGEERTNFILANSVFLVVFGTNDISNSYFLSRIRQVQYDFPSYADFMVNSASNFLKRTAAGGIERKIVVQYNEAVELYNTKLSKGLTSVNQNYPDSKIVYIDVYNPLLDIIVNSNKYGYKVEDRGCCGTGIIEVVLLCNHLVSTCPNDLEFVFWDSFHPTESVYKRLIAPIVQKYLKDFL
ncbi:GDSL esterase/lipase, partial [Trifolium pratense]